MILSYHSQIIVLQQLCRYGSMNSVSPFATFVQKISYLLYINYVYYDHHNLKTVTLWLIFFQT